MKPQTPATQNTKPTTPKKQRPPKPNLTIIGLPTADNTYTFTPLYKKMAALLEKAA